MVETVLGIAIGLFFFISTIKAYSVGIKHGKNLADRIVPTIELNPLSEVKKVQEEKRIKEQSDLINEWLNGGDES